MTKTGRLNVAVIEDDVLTALKQDAPPSFAVSRRQALGFAGVAAVGASPALKMVEGTLSGSFSLHRSPGRAVFRYRGKDRWVVDTALYCGSPHLRVNETPDEIEVKLTGARYPGTEIRGDFSCLLKRGVSGWRMTLRPGLGKATLRADFESWLLGKSEAAGNISLRPVTQRLGERFELRLTGHARIEYLPTNAVRVHGHGIVEATGLGKEIVSDSLAVSVLSKSDASLVHGRRFRGSLVTMSRGSRPWELDLPTATPGARLESVDAAFDSLTVETRETATGGRSGVLVAMSDRTDVALNFFPSPKVFGADHKPFRLPLRHARYAMTYGSDDAEMVLSATYCEVPEWMHLAGCSLLIGLGNEPGTFLLTRRSGVTKVKCAPAIYAFAAGMADAVVEPHTLSTPAPMEMVWSNQPGSSRNGHARVTLPHPQSDITPHVVIPNYVVSILRPEDLLSIRLEYVNWGFETGGGLVPRLVRLSPAPVYSPVIVHFPPQNVAEQAYFEVEPASGPSLPAGDPDSGSPNEKPRALGNVPANIAGPSRLAFEVDASITSIPYSLDAVLDWTKFTQRVTSTALPPGAATGGIISQPAADQTSIESPYRLMLSPSRYAYWNHTTKLVPGPKGEVELWHTRLGVRDPNGKTHDDNDSTRADLRTVRAVWSPDYTATSKVPPHYDSTLSSVWNPYRASTDAKDRYDIVRASSDFNSAGILSKKYTPVPVSVDKFMLTTLGSWMNVRGMWEDHPITTATVELEEWRHRATMARDHYVRIVEAGFLFPFGHKASLVKITERKFYRTLSPTGAPGSIVAYLFQHMFIIVRQPVKGFSGPSKANQPGTWDYPHLSQWHDGFEGRQFPFKSVEITTLVTPDLDKPESHKAFSPAGPPHGPIDAQDCFWPNILVNGKIQDYQWHCKGTDWDGNITEFTCPLVFVGLDVTLPTTANTQANLTTLTTDYMKSGKNSFRTHGQNIAFAPSDPTPPPGNQGVDPSVETTSVTLAAAIPPHGTPLVPDQPEFFPTFAVASVKVPAIKHLIGTNTDNTVAVAEEFLTYGFDGNKNKGEVFIHLVASDFPSSGKSKQVGLVFGKGANGQLVTPGALQPNLSVAGLSRMLGPVGAGEKSPGKTDLSGVGGGTFNPKDFFGDPSSLLTSNFPKLLGEINLSDLLSELTDFTNQLNKVPGLHVKVDSDKVMVQYFWETDQIQSILCFSPGIYDSDGTNTQGDIKVGSPPPPPDVADDGDGNVDNSGDTPTHVWAASYQRGAKETVVGVGTTYDMSQGGGTSGDRKIKVTVQKGPAGTTGINIYRSEVGKSWPLYKVGAVSANVVGTGTVDYEDDTTDSDLTNGAKPKTWAQFAIEMMITIPLTGGDPTYNITGELYDFSLSFDVIAIPFNSLKFTIDTGAKLNVAADVNEVVFINSLQFVNQLRDFLSAFGDPPFLDVEDTEIDCGYTLSIPTIAVGAFSLQNIELGAKIIIPYFGDSVSVGFNFCSKENPFILTVYIFGGGGFFEIDLSPKGIVGVHAGFEFGVDCALDLVIASGQVHIMAGIYYDYTISDGTKLTGFVDAGGSLEVLGLITVSVDFHLELDYEAQPNGDSSVTGEASLTVEIDLTLFSFSVTLGPLKKTFAGSSTTHDIARGIAANVSPPDVRLPVATMIDKSEVWKAYTMAFAA